ncbi:hypothetical protein SEUCBS140593_009955 [Sporothrix eucalyptigena]|uniref:Zn(2)-C6 fungal-type domain-containing protein n=1 Tax=Sporothrix eucalyptigena TaxID=1812306 RepID=A0ABP0D0V0_9PEZI
MNTIRQKRQSCEACRVRKLKCSGESRSCARCRSRNVVCHYQDKGVPGRPRKTRRPESRDIIMAVTAHPTHPISPSETSPASNSTICHGSHGRSGSRGSVDDLVLDPFALPLVTTTLPDPSTDAAGEFDFGSLSIEMFGQCPLVRHHHEDEASLTTPLSPALSPTLSPPLSPASCHCADDVSALVRALRHRAPLSHAIVGDLRAGADLVQRLLTCSICYDTKKAPRLTIENVLLIGRLMHEVTTGYRRYLRWVRGDHTDDSDNAREQTETVHLVLESAPSVMFQIQPHKVQEVILNGLQADAVRLTDLGARFALRQHNRHMVGHETCPDPEGRCWREHYDIDNDPLDICPRNAAARTLTPCYRVVDAIRSAIKAFADDVEQKSN